MPELTQKERLQPSLLDRLSDDEPAKTQESRDQRVLSLPKLREAVLRDLEWLLNSNGLDAVESLDDYPLVAGSVVNYGIPDLTGHPSANIDVAAIERLLTQAIRNFEPRILRSTLHVRAVVAEEEMSHNAIAFEIEGQLWAQPAPLRLYLKTEVDLDNGNVAIKELSG